MPKLYIDLNRFPSRRSRNFRKFRRFVQNVARVLLKICLALAVILFFAALVANNETLDRLVTYHLIFTFACLIACI